MTQYVLGFLFDERGKNVALIRKEHPEWQKGKLNGLGGKVELGEPPFEAMCREFKEEAGVYLDTWKPFATILGKDYTVYCFKAFSEEIWNAKKQEDENIGVFILEETAYKSDLLFNVNWLIPLALDKEEIFTTITYK